MRQERRFYLDYPRFSVVVLTSVPFVFQNHIQDKPLDLFVMSYQYIPIPDGSFSLPFFHDLDNFEGYQSNVLRNVSQIWGCLVFSCVRTRVIDLGVVSQRRYVFIILSFQKIYSSNISHLSVILMFVFQVLWLLLSFLKLINFTSGPKFPSFFSPILLETPMLPSPSIPPSFLLKMADIPQISIKYGISSCSLKHHPLFYGWPR